MRFSGREGELTTKARWIIWSHATASHKDAVDRRRGDFAHRRAPEASQVCMDETRLIEKLRLIETLFSGATTEGERVAADRARQRILERLALSEAEDPPIEYRFSMPDMWSRKVFVALLRRYGLRPYRYRGQRYTTVMARVSKPFVDETLWPEFQEISEALQTYLSDVTDRVVHQVIHQDSSEAEVLEQPAQLPLDVGEADSGLESAGSSPATTQHQQVRPPGQVAGGSRSGARLTDRRKKRKKRKRR